MSPNHLQLIKNSFWPNELHIIIFGVLKPPLNGQRQKTNELTPNNSSEKFSFNILISIQSFHELKDLSKIKSCENNH